jgi:glycosyltransferase involved in cell wall biosynthesis
MIRVLIVQHGLFPGFIAPEAKEYGKHLTKLGLKVTVVNIGRKSNVELRERLGFPSFAIEARSIFRIYQELKQFISSVDVVHYLPGKRLELMPLLDRRVKYVFDQRSVSVSGSKIKDVLINFAKRLQPIFANHVIFTDEPLARALRPIRPIPVSLLPAGYPAELFYPCPPFTSRGPKPLLYQGAVRPARRLGHLVQLLARLPEEYTLTIVGGGLPADEAYRKELWQLAQSLRCADRLTLTGGVPQEDVRAYIEGAYLCLSYVPMTSLFRDQAVLKTLEYLACARPVLATATRHTCQFSERIGSNRILLTNGTLEDMATKIVSAGDYIDRFYSDENLEYLPTALAEFSWEHQIRTRLLPIYQSVLSKSN